LHICILRETTLSTENGTPRTITNDSSKKAHKSNLWLGNCELLTYIDYGLIKICISWEMASSTENGTPGLNSQRQEPRQTDNDSSKESAQVELMVSGKKVKFTENGTPGLNSQRQEPRQTDDDSSKKSAQVELMASGKKAKL
ncbi:40550_t:CDS:2, partial [Gigaspora margarita]